MTAGAGMTGGARMTGGDRLTAAGVTAVLLACSAFVPVFDGLGWLLPALGVLAAVTAAGVAGRRAGVPPALHPLIGLAVVIAYAVVLYAGSSLHHLVLPGRDTVLSLRALLESAGSDLDAYAPPAPTTSALVLLVVLGVGGVAVLVDALAVVAGRAALAGLPLLLLFAVPSAVLSGGLGWFTFVLGAAGWLGLLLVEGRERVGRWGAPVARPARGSEDPTGITRVGRRIGAAALGVAVVVPALLPGLDSRLFDGGSGDGPGSGGSGGGSGTSRTVTTYNPITRLQGQLRLPAPQDVLRYTTDDPAPDYLRMTTLGIYDGNGWRQEPLSGNTRQNGVDKQLPLPQGRAATTVARVVTDRISLLSLNAFWLPAPATPTKVDVKGQWMWEPKSESVFATRPATSKLGPYTVHSSRVLPDPLVIAQSEADAVPEPVKPYAGELRGVGRRVLRITSQVTQTGKTDYGRALAIQAWFHDPANNFRYDTSTSPGSSPDQLDSFLTTRVGYCEQYASAMAAMLRIAGIPSRVAIGFTPGSRQSDGTYVVTTSQAHAWPEAWFAGAGWVRFEPTPPGNGITTPAYGAATSAAGTPQSSQVPGGTTSADGNADETPQQRAQRLEEERLAKTAADSRLSGSSADGGPPVRQLAVGGGVLLLLVSPALLHTGRRRHRWRSADPAAAWNQVRDDATDVGHGWRAADSPRTAARRLVGDRYLDGEAAAAVERLAHAVERSRYARPGGEPVAAGAADVALVRHALLQGSRVPTRLRARLLPPSTVRWASASAGTALADLLDAVDGALSNTTLRVRRRLRAWHLTG